jgi:hypothetical protein
MMLHGEFKGKAILGEAMRKAEVELAAGAAQTSTRILQPSANDADQTIQTSMKSDDDFFTFNETEPESVACNALAEMEMPHRRHQ